MTPWPSIGGTQRTSDAPRLQHRLRAGNRQRVCFAYLLKIVVYQTLDASVDVLGLLLKRMPARCASGHALVGPEHFKAPDARCGGVVRILDGGCWYREGGFGRQGFAEVAMDRL